MAKSLKELMLEKKKEIAENSGRRAPALKPPMGTTRFRILPTWRPEGSQFFHDFGEHFIKDAADKVLAVYVCVDKTFGKTCPICEALAEGVRAATTDEAKTLIKKSFAGTQILVNALQVEKDATTPIVLALSPTTFDKLIDVVQQNADPEDDDFNIVTDPNKGVDVLITRSGTGLKTEYGIQPALKGSKPVPKAVLEKMTNLDEYVSREYEAGLLKAQNAVSEALKKVVKLLPPSVDDSEFENDFPDSPHATPKAGDRETIEGSYKDVTGAEMNEDELNALLGDLGD